MRALDIGSGHNPVEQSGWATPGDTADFEFVKMDLFHEDVDCRHDFNETPYPFPDDHFDAIFARHSLEHVHRERLLEVIQEIHRIGRDGAEVYIRVPYWNSESFAGDPTHWNMFSETTFRHFCRGGSLNTEYYVPPLFEMVSIEFRFHPKFRFLPKRLLRELMHVLTGVCDELWVVLRVAKSDAERRYEPRRIYAFNTHVAPSWRAMAFYGALFYGSLAVVVASLLKLVGLL